MNFKKIIPSLASACLFFSIQASGAKPFPEIVGADAYALFHLESVPSIQGKWDDNSIVSWFEGEPFQQILSALKIDSKSEASEDPDFKMILQDEFGITEEELLEFFPGQLAFAVYGMGSVFEGSVSGGGTQQDFAMMAEFSGTKERLDELMQIQFDRNGRSQAELNGLIEHEMIEELFMGETLHFDKRFDGENSVIEDGYALVDGIVLLATPESRLRLMVEAIKEGPSKSFASTTVFRRSTEMDQEACDVSVYLNFSSFFPNLIDRIFDKNAEATLAMAGTTVASLRTVLALDVIDGFFLHSSLQDDGLSFAGGLVYEKKKGLLKLLSYGSGELPEALYVPTGVSYTSVSLFDLSLMLSELETMLSELSPSMVGLLDMQLSSIQANTGADIRASLLENFGAELVSIGSLGGLSDSGAASSIVGSQEELYVFGIKDAESLSLTIEAMKDMYPGARDMIRVREHAGHTIYTFEAPTDPLMQLGESQNFSYVVTRSKLFMNKGGIGLLQEVLNRMEVEEAGLWQGATAVDLFSRIERSNPVARSFVDLGKIAEMFSEADDMTGFLQNLGVEIETLHELGQSAGAFKLISEMNEVSDGFFFRSLIVESEASQ